MKKFIKKVGIVSTSLCLMFLGIKFITLVKTDTNNDLEYYQD